MSSNDGVNVREQMTPVELISQQTESGDSLSKKTSKVFELNCQLGKFSTKEKVSYNSEADVLLCGNYGRGVTLVSLL